jgi:hypothetical protein
MVIKTPKGGKQLYIQHLDTDSPKPAREYLLSLGIDKNSVDVLFHQNGDWKYRVNEEINPFLLTPKDLEKKLIENLTPVYDLVSKSLDSIHELGFAKHDIPHIKDVTDEVLKLLNKSGADEKTKIIGVTAAVIHDLGNIFSRKHHSLLSPLIFKLTFPKFIINREDWFRVKNAVVYHDEPVIFEEIASWGEIDASKKIEMFKKVFKNEVLALLISDKTRISRKRLSDKNQTIKAIDENEHYEVNLLGQTDSIVVKKDLVLVKINYHPYATEEEVINFPGFFKKSKHFGYRASVSRGTIQLHKYETPIDNFSAWRHKYWKIYSERTLLAIYSLFALFPSVKRVGVQMIDHISPISKSFERVEYHINKSELNRFEKFIRLKYFNKSLNES